MNFILCEISTPIYSERNSAKKASHVKLKKKRKLENSL